MKFPIILETDQLGFLFSVKVTVLPVEEIAAYPLGPHEIILADDLTPYDLALVIPYEVYRVFFSVRDQITASPESETDLFSQLCAKIYDDYIRHY
jgi:hypothetical protein